MAENLFFSRERHIQYKRTNVGGTGDCGFRSIAASLIDNFKSASKMDEQLLKSLLDAFYLYYPEYRPKQGMLTATEKFEHLFRQLENPELVVALGYVLRQMAVDEMLAHPEYYRGVFTDIHEGTSPEQMRKMHTWIDESSIAALARVLNIRINLKVYEKNKELPLSLVYHAKAVSPTKMSVNVALEGQHYMPELRNPDLFKSLKNRQARIIEYKSIERQEPSMSEILKRIEADDRRMLEVYEHTKKSLDAAVEDGELTLENLLERYIHAISHSDYLEGRTRYIGLEFTNEAFFCDLIARYQASGSSQKPVVSQDKMLRRELVHALARAVSIGQLSEEALFQEEVKLPQREKALFEEDLMPPQLSVRAG